MTSQWWYKMSDTSTKMWVSLMVWNYSDKDVKLLMASAQVFAEVFIRDSNSELLKQRNSSIGIRQRRSDRK